MAKVVLVRLNNSLWEKPGSQAAEGLGLVRST